MKFLLNREVLRRLALVAGFFTALVFFLVPVRWVYRVELVDFAQMREAQKAWNDNSRLPLSEFIAEETDGREKAVSGPEWEKVLDRLVADRQGETPPEWESVHYGSVTGDSEFFFGPDEEPFASAAPGPGRVAWLAMEREGRPLHIFVNTQRPKYARRAPTHLVHPWRAWSWLPFLVGLVLYFRLPKVNKPPHSLGYLRLWGLVVSDFLGLIIAGFLFAFPMAMILQKGEGLSSLFDFESGWAWLTIITWALTAFGFFIMAIGAWYRNFWITFLDDGLARHSITGVRTLKYADMQDAAVTTMPVSKWIIGGLLAFGGGHPTAMGQAAMLAGQNHTGIEIRMKDGKPVWIRLEAFQQPHLVARHLKDHDVPMDSNLEKLL